VDLELAEVILGLRCELTLAAVRDLTRLKHQDAVTFKAMAHADEYKVVPDPSSLP
jgi:hypothetical protein